VQKIPFLDLSKVHNDFKEEINSSINNVVKSGDFILGKELNLFEKEYAIYNCAKFCIGVGSGLDALSFLLIAAGVKKGDEVIVPAHTFIATWLSVTNIGAIPVGIEPDEKTYNINPSKIKEKITSKTRAIIVVNLYGQLADLQPIKIIAEEYSLYLFEDGAQSQGAMYKKKNSILFSDGIATSFYPGKNLGCFGDGGAVLTNKKTIYDKVKLLRNYGSIKKYDHKIIGFNSRLDELQSAILRVKLKYLKKMNEERKVIANFYEENLRNYDIILPKKIEEAEHVWHLYVIRVDKRDQLSAYLGENGITTLIHYPVPPHKQKCYAKKNMGEFPLTEKICSEIISLPIYPGMPIDHQEEVVLNIKKYFSK